ncbi:hypothetical protein ACLKA6_013703 [Drosophila palustris]
MATQHSPRRSSRLNQTTNAGAAMVTTASTVSIASSQPQLQHIASTVAGNLSVQAAAMNATANTVMQKECAQTSSKAGEAPTSDTQVASLMQRIAILEENLRRATADRVHVSTASDPVASSNIGVSSATTSLPPYLSGNAPPLLSANQPLQIMAPSNGNAPLPLSENLPPQSNGIVPTYLSGNLPTQINGIASTYLSGNVPAQINGIMSTSSSGSLPPYLCASSSHINAVPPASNCYVTMSHARPYGMEHAANGSCSPSAAHYVKTINALEHQHTDPRAVKAITEYHYVDDYVDSFTTETEAIAVSTRLIICDRRLGPIWGS